MGIAIDIKQRYSWYRRLVFICLLVLFSCRPTNDISISDCWVFALPQYQDISNEPRNGSFVGDRYIEAVLNVLGQQFDENNVRLIDVPDTQKRSYTDTLFLKSGHIGKLLDRSNWSFINIRFHSVKLHQNSSNISIRAKWLGHEFLKHNDIYEMSFVMNEKLNIYQFDIRWLGMIDDVENISYYGTRGIYADPDTKEIISSHDPGEAQNILKSTFTSFDWIPYNFYENIEYVDLFHFAGSEPPNEWMNLSWDIKRKIILELMSEIEIYVTDAVEVNFNGYPRHYYFKFNNLKYSKSPLVIAASVHNHEWIFPRHIMDGTMFQLYRENPRSAVHNFIDEYKRVGLIE